MVLFDCAREIWGVLHDALCGELGTEATTCLSFITARTWDCLKRCIRGPGHRVDSLPYKSLASPKQIAEYLKKIVEFLSDNNTGVVGIHGMGGIGKTTLLRILNNELLRNRIARRFDHIIFITVTQSPNIDQIKIDIEKQINGNLSSLGNSRFLLLLDDVREKVDLINMEIPVPSNENGCKVILTARDEVHCQIADNCLTVSTQSLEVNLLRESEAWNFFKSKVGKDLDQEGEEIVMFARKMVERCGGLPLALTLIGSSMARASSVNDWRDAERNLSKSPPTINGVAEDHELLHLLDHGFPGPGKKLYGTPEVESLAGQEGIKDYLKRMKEFLYNEETTLLGIHGVGRTGKTTLLRIFNNNIVGSSIARRFDHIIFITLSKSPDIGKIKRDINEQIGGSLSSLGNNNRFLLLLDDVWEEVDLTSVGIQTIPSSQNRCKVIMTGRSESNCHITHVDPTNVSQFIEVPTLTESEAWIFFQSIVGTEGLDTEGGELARLAKNVANSCSGIPLTVEAIGKRMKGASSVYEWSQVERFLKLNPPTIEGVGEDVLEMLDDEIRGPVQEVGTPPYENLAGQEQIKDFLMRTKGFLKDEKASVLGIYGMGGVGKTTLLKIFKDELVRINPKQRLFDHIIFITLSQAVDVEKIKEDIKGQIRGNLSSLSRSRFLLLLDDVWNEVDLMSMGIPIPSPQNRCKVIMTGRSKSYCLIKDVDVKDGTRSFQVSTLTESEAWIFFQRNIGKTLDSKSGEITKLAKSVASQCGGLPLALKIVGHSMIDATIYDWNVAEINLTRCPQNQKDMEDKVLLLLRFSFDRLKDDTIRNCLLYCCLWGDGEAIPKDDLIDYWFGEGFLDCDHSESLHEARVRGQVNIITLVSHSLLEEVPRDNRYVKMHDVVRDMCLWLTSGKFDEYGKFCAYLKRDHNHSSSTMTLKNVQRLSAKTNWYPGEKTLPRDFIPSPNLHTLLCGRNYYPSFQIEEGFLQNCKFLRVLELKTCVLNFALKDLTLLGQLRYLGLSCTKLRTIPDEIDSLFNLVHLDLSWNENLEILPDTIGNLLKLQKLDCPILN